VAPAIPLSPFPPPPSLTFAKTADGRMQSALNAAIGRLSAAPSFRIAIIDLDGSADLRWAAHDGNIMDYIASEPKIIALYAAMALRDMARRFHIARPLIRAAATLGARVMGQKPPPEPRLFDQLRQEMNPAILAAGDSRLATTRPHERVPNYEAVLHPPRTGMPDFTRTYRDALRAMIVPSSNPGAGTCIRGVGYSYMSGAMKEALLFRNGIGPWLAGDYVGQYTYARIDSKNDDGVAQAGTALSMAKLMAIIMKRGVAFMHGDAYTDMHTLLEAAAQTGPDTPFVTRAEDFPAAHRSIVFPRKVVTHSKLGFGPLKKKNGGVNVGSEVSRIEGLEKSGKAYIMAYQNLDWRYNDASDIAFVARETLKAYE